MISAAPKGEAQEIKQMRELVSEFFTPKPHLYYIDFSITILVAYASAYLFLTAADYSWIQAGCFLLAGVAMFRAATFIHEVVHLGNGQMDGFIFYWNLLFGVPFGLPSFLYDCHNEHHKTRLYGTRADGEYYSMGAGPIWKVFFYFAQIPIIPIGSLFRFAFLVPVSLLSKRFRRWLLENASSYVIAPGYRHDLGKRSLPKWWFWADIASSVVVIGALSLIWLGIASWSIVIKVYALIVFSITLNWIRTLAAHRYIHQGEAMSFLEQFLDTLNVVDRSWFTELFFFPVGLRYHALHHLFPGIPYHNLGKAHQKLVKSLPKDSPYFNVLHTSLWSAIKQTLSTSWAGTFQRIRPATA